MTDRHASPGLRLLVMAAALALGALLAMAFATRTPCGGGPAHRRPDSSHRGGGES